MLQYIQRMTTEQTDLDGKIRRAKNALLKSDEINLDGKEEALLQEQLSAMEKYRAVLHARIEYAKQLHGE